MEMMDVDQEGSDTREIFSREPTTLESEEVVHHVCEYLTLKDLKTFRRVSTMCNVLVNEHPCFALKSHGIIRRKWHDESIGFNPDNTIQFKHLTLRRFVYFKYSKLFQSYWLNAAQNLTHLTIQDTSMECYGFANILNHLPILDTLILTGAKLRDTDNHHLLEDDQPNKCLGPFAKPLRHLTIENTCRIEGCFFEYLGNRTGQLETFSVKTCFDASQGTPAFNRQRVDHQIFEFQFYLLELLRVNANTLTKFTCENNHIVTSRIFRVYKDFPTPNLKDLTVSFSDDTVKNFVGECAPDVVSNMTDIIEFFKAKGSQLQSLRMIGEGQVSNEILEQLLDPCKDSLLSLRLTLCSATTLRPEVIDLPVLKEMKKLEKLEIFDRKVVSRKDVSGFMNRKTKPEMKEELRTKLKSSIKTTRILPFLPAEVKELTLFKLISQFDMYADLPPDRQTNVVASFRKLTRLEIRGPWLPTIKPTLDMIVKEAKQLRTLILSDCFITDSDLTGLSESEIREFRLCHTHLIKMVEENDADSENMNVNDITNFDKFHSCFALLPELKNLDLSGNTTISDVSLLQPLRVPGLQTLNLSGCNITDKGLDLISKSLPSLKILNLRHCWRVSKFGLNQVIKACPKLHRIYCSSKRKARIGANVGLFKTEWSPNFEDVLRYNSPKPENGTENEDKAESEADADGEASVENNAEN